MPSTSTYDAEYTARIPLSAVIIKEGRARFNVAGIPTPYICATNRF